MLSKLSQRKKETYELRFHPQATKDMANLPASLRQKLLEFCQKELALNPTLYAKPLRGSQKGYWKLRIGDYLVGLKIVENLLLVLGVIPYLHLYQDSRRWRE